MDSNKHYKIFIYRECLFVQIWEYSGCWEGFVQRWGLRKNNRSQELRSEYTLWRIHFCLIRNQTEYDLWPWLCACWSQTKIRLLTKEHFCKFFVVPPLAATNGLSRRFGKNMWDKIETHEILPKTWTVKPSYKLLKSFLPWPDYISYWKLFFHWQICTVKQGRNWHSKSGGDGDI